MSGVAIAIGLGTAATGAIVQSENSKKAAKAAGDAANAQAAEAGRQRDFIVNQAGENQRQAMALAEASPQELAALERSYAAASNNLDREARLLAAIDPSMMEASQQALKLLRGENSGYGSAVANQRKVMRDQLLGKLRAQYGAGAETSSVGQNLLSQFDQETNLMLQQANQGALQNAFGMATFDAGGRLRTAIGQNQQVGQGFGALQDRKLGAQVNTGNALLSALSGTSQQMINAAGAPHVQGVMEAQGQAQLGGSLMGIGGNIAGMGMYGAFNKKPTADSPLKTTDNTHVPPGGQSYGATGGSMAGSYGNAMGMSSFAPDTSIPYGLARYPGIQR